MIPATVEEQKKEAFRLFEDGRYTESLRWCQAVLEKERDPAVEILSATNLFSAGRLEDAEASFRDLARKMPDSSYVHSYLAKVLEARGDEGATAEYAAAVHLDPTNQDALRSYARYLLGHRDFSGSLRVLRRLVLLARKPEDVRDLMRALIETGEPAEALATRDLLGEGAGWSYEYIDALAGTKNYPAAAKVALGAWHDTKDPAVLRRYLGALAQYDLPASYEAYDAHLADTPDDAIRLDFVLLLQENGRCREALEALRPLLAGSPSPSHRLMECRLLAATGQEEQALAAYEHLARDELAAKNDLSGLRQILGAYRRFLATLPDPADAGRRYLALVSKDISVASLLETAEYFEENGNSVEARAWYYRAYRAEYLAGGLEYARFLSRHSEDRECEKVMLYILANVKKVPDLTRIAEAIVDRAGGMYRHRRLMEQMIVRLEERRPALGSAGLELLAMAFFITATNALEEMDYAGCKYSCLFGMDVLPVPSRSIRIEEFVAILRACKARSVSDLPVIHERRRAARKERTPQPAAIADQLALSEAEQKIVMFLQSHKKATEMDLRKILGTRRVVGIVNILIRKASEQGLVLIEKKGVGEEGEIYEYAGT